MDRISGILVFEGCFQKLHLFLLIFTHSDPEAQPRGGPKADISETFRSTVRGCGGRAPTTHPQGRISGLPKGSPVNGLLSCHFFKQNHENLLKTWFPRFLFHALLHVLLLLPLLLLLVLSASAACASVFCFSFSCCFCYAGMPMFLHLFLFLLLLLLLSAFVLQLLPMLL